jgi:CRP/FNR family transcriptional regulator, cyclic AMP receptor protein
MNQADVIGYAAALLVFVTFWMKTMVPLRTLGIASNLFFIVYGYLAGAYPPLLLHVLLLPLNLMRLREMLQLSRQVKEAASGNLNMDWLKPFSSKRRMQAGEVLFNKGETADRMFIIVSGRCRLAESGVDLAPGAVVGELALLSPDKTRTQTMQSTESGSLLEITYGQVRQLYLQNPTFGFYFLELASKRLFENIGRLEAEVARLRAHSIQQGEASTPA